MKSCPRCGKTYPDGDVFCETDGSALVQITGAWSAGGGAQGESAPSEATGNGSIECPTCGGRAEPGEIICNFCGTRLQPEAAADPALAGRAAPGARPSPSTQRTAADPENFIPSQARGSQLGGGQAPYYQEPARSETSTGRRIFGLLGYSIAAIVALAAGAWLAIHLSSGETIPPVAEISPSAAPGISGPLVALAGNMQIGIRSTDATAPRRDRDSVQKVFDDNHDALLDTYKHALEGDSSLRDGMLVRVHVMPDGSVSGSSVVVSTAPNPSLDAEMVKAVGGWRFPPASGAAVDVDYPVIFAASGGDVGALETDLNTKVASLGPSETPEYATSAAPSPIAAATPPPEAVPALPSTEATPPATALAPPPSTARPHRHHRLSEELASVPKHERMPSPSLGERVTAALAANRKFRRVQAFASPGGIVTLNGKVFDDDAKQSAERTARRVDGVTSVIDNLTTDTAQWARNEASITQALQSAGLTGVTVKVIGDSAYLDGTVKSDQDREHAVTVAVSAAPVKVRTNLIRVDPGFFGL
jgi:TonB family protein